MGSFANGGGCNFLLYYSAVGLYLPGLPPQKPYCYWIYLYWLLHSSVAKVESGYNKVLLKSFLTSATSTVSPHNLWIMTKNKVLLLTMHCNCVYGSCKSNKKYEPDYIWPLFVVQLVWPQMMRWLISRLSDFFCCRADVLVKSEVRSNCAQTARPFWLRINLSQIYVL